MCRYPTSLVELVRCSRSKSMPCRCSLCRGECLEVDEVVVRSEQSRWCAPQKLDRPQLGAESRRGRSFGGLLFQQVCAPRLTRTEMLWMQRKCGDKCAIKSKIMRESCYLFSAQKTNGCIDISHGVGVNS